MTHYYKRLLVVSLVALLFACGGISPQANFYRLNVINAAQSPESNNLKQSATPKLSIQIMPISIDETVDRPQIVITNSEHEVQYLEQQRWAQPLKYEIGRVISEQLSAQLSNGMVTAYPHQLSDSDIQISLQVLAFESSYTAPATLKVNLTVHNLRTSQTISQTLAYTHAVLSENAQASIEDIIDAHNVNISQLSQAILTAISTM